MISRRLLTIKCIRRSVRTCHTARKLLKRPQSDLKRLLFQWLFPNWNITEYKELTLGANLAKQDLDRYRWNHQGVKPQAQEPDLNDTASEIIWFRPMAIKTYLLTVKSR